MPPLPTKAQLLAEFGGDGGRVCQRCAWDAGKGYTWEVKAKKHLLQAHGVQPPSMQGDAAARADAAVAATGGAPELLDKVPFADLKSYLARHGAWSGAAGYGATKQAVVALVAESLNAKGAAQDRAGKKAARARTATKKPTATKKVNAKPTKVAKRK